MATPPDQNQNENENENETLEPPNSPPQSDEQQQEAGKSQSQPPAMMTSSRNTTNKRRKTYKRRKPSKKIIHLTDSLNPIPFVPPKTLDLDKHQDVLKKVGLFEFSRIDFDFDRVRVLKTDLIVQLIGNYDPKRRCSYVNDMRVGVNRADLARALKLPPARQDRDRAAVEEVDLDSEVFSYESIEFLEEFVHKWIVLRDEPRVVSGEMVGWARCIRDGHPEKMDVASLIWSRVEKELSLGDKLVDCYYASHLLCLIRSQKPDFFIDEEEKEEECNLETEVEEPAALEEVTITDQHTKDDETMADADLDEQVDCNDVSGDHFLQPCRNSSLVNVEQVEDEHVEEVKVLEVEDEHIEEVKVEEVEHEHIEEVKVEEVEEEHIEEVKVEEVEHEHIEEVKVEEVEEEHIEEVKVEEVEHEHIEEDKVEEVEEVEEERNIEQVDDDDVDDEEEEEHEGGERMDEGFDMEANDDSFDRDGLTTDNFLQGVETSHNPYNSHGMSSMDLFGCSFYNNGGKRVMEPEEEEDIQMQNGIQNSKRIKTEEITWDQKQNDIDIGFCFDQIQQLMQKAKMIHESKERSYENVQYSQQIAVDQLQERLHILEMMIKSKDEELAKKHNEVFRLERELYLMSDLVSGYRKALIDTRSKFSDYRKRAQLKEEPLYRDAGPGGLVLSVREIERQRLKQEEEMMKIQIVAKNFEEECVYRLQMHSNRLSPMFDKLVVIENEVHMLKELSAKAKEAQVEPSAELAPSVEPEENQKSMVEDESSVEPEKDLKSMDVDESLVEAEKNQDAPNEITEENYVSMDGVLPDAAGESEEKADGEED
ncbi:uncharacterized protein LOC143621203 [Bidens hawaiensis]|uniref:uncharacterized protein LOC143621203 n=1 Tax=Bidens hawaiensis TaxID=980011 RepID=UPI0040493ED5